MRQGLCIGTDGYSIKDLEPLYDCQREGEVKNAQASVVQYFQWQQAGSPKDSPLLKHIRDYNQLDCESTKRLADWLRELQREHGIAYQPVSQAEEHSTSKHQNLHQEAAQLADELLAEIPQPNTDKQERIQQLLAHLLEFYHREDKPFWWQRFTWLEMDESDLIEQLDCLAGLERTQTEPYKPKPKSRSLAYEYRFDPSQETKLKPNSRCWFAPTMPVQGCTLLDLAVDTGRAILTVSNKALTEAREDYPEWNPPQRTSLIDCNYIGKEKLAQSILDTVTAWRQTGKLQSALQDFLERRAPSDSKPPRTSDHS